MHNNRIQEQWIQEHIIPRQNEAVVWQKTVSLEPASHQGNLRRIQFYCHVNYSTYYLSWNNDFNTKDFKISMLGHRPLYSLRLITKALDDWHYGSTHSDSCAKYSKAICQTIVWKFRTIMVFFPKRFRQFSMLCQTVELY